MQRGWLCRSVSSRSHDLESVHGSDKNVTVANAIRMWQRKQSNVRHCHILLFGILTPSPTVPLWSSCTHQPRIWKEKWNILILNLSITQSEQFGSWSRGWVAAAAGWSISQKYRSEGFSIDLSAEFTTDLPCTVRRTRSAPSSAILITFSALQGNRIPLNKAHE